MADLISTEQYAAHRGVSPRAVRKAIATGRLSASLHRQGKNWKVDPDMADQEWLANTMQSTLTPPGPKTPRTPRASVAIPPPSQAAPGLGQSQATAVRTIMQAKLLELNLKERQGQLVSRQAERKRWYEAGRKLRDDLRRLPLMIVGDMAQIMGGLTSEQRAELLILMERQIVAILKEATDRGA